MESINIREIRRSLKMNRDKFRYDLNYRNYYTVTQGSISVKLSPPKSSKYLYSIIYSPMEMRI